MGRSVTRSFSSGRGRAPFEGVGALRASASKCSVVAALVPSYASGRRGGGAGKVFARQGVESAKEDVGLLYPKISSPSTARELELFPTQRWSDAVKDELATLNDDGGRAAREAFVGRGEITEVDMVRLVDSLLQEEGQSAEDYHRRAIFFNLVAEFFRQGKSYSVEKDEFRTSMHMLVDSILAEDGRSPTDYNARAQFFTKSAEVFPFNAEVGQI